MIIFPLLLVFLEWNHPRGFSKDVYGGLSAIATQWKYLHIYQGVLFGGVAVGAMFLTWNSQNIFGFLSKLFLFIFAVAYLIFDSTAGISVGFILQASQDDPSLDPKTIKSLAQLLYNDPIVGGTGSFFSLLGSWTWVLGICSAIIALAIDNRTLPLWKSLPPYILLAISGYALYVGHFSPYGPIAFAAFALAALWFEIFRFGPAKAKAEV